MEFIYSNQTISGVELITIEGNVGKSLYDIGCFFKALGKRQLGDCQIQIDPMINGSVHATDLVNCIVWAVMQGGYHFSKQGLKHLQNNGLFANRDSCITYSQVVIYLVSKTDLHKHIGKAQKLAQSIGYARLLGDMPNNYLHIGDFVTYAQHMAAATSLHCTVYHNKELQEMQCGGILGVNQGTQEEAAMLSISYHGAGESPYTALVGKGILFDSGGYHLKNIDGMEGMKYDMCGAANVLELMEYAALTRMEKNLVAVIPLAENLISPKALKMGDVITTMSGKTVEIYNTDAEGRLLLCDAITYACKKANIILDFATLTYSCKNALGDKITGVFCNADDLFEKLWQSAKQTGEKIWRMPLDEIFHKDIKWSKTADLANYAPGKNAAASTAACFLEEFVEENIKWAHFDMVGSASTKGNNEEMEDGATGANMATAVAYLEQSG